jgi:hypothetical protein
MFDFISSGFPNFYSCFQAPFDLFNHLVFLDYVMGKHQSSLDAIWMKARLETYRRDCGESYRVFLSLAKTSELEDGFRDMAFEYFVRTIDRFGTWMEKNSWGGVRKGGLRCWVILDLLKLDIFVVIVTACKVGYKVSSLYLGLK